MNARHLLVAASLSLTLPACSDDTGILVDVYGDELTVAVDRLDTMVIVDDGSGAVPGDADWGLADNREDAIAGDLDLRTAPYRVMFRPDGVERDATVWVAALAYDDTETVIGWGQLGAPIAFEPDLVKQVELHLHPAGAVGDGCVVEGDQVVVRSSDDCDGDAFTYDVDCDDLDPLIAGDVDGDPQVCDFDCDTADDNVFEGNTEACDGLDNDCDPSSLPRPELCVQVEREGKTITGCGVGQRLCDDSDAGLFGACLASPLSVESNGELCEAWGQCLQSAMPQDCLTDGGLACKVKTGAGGPCLDATASLHDLIPGDPDQCGFRLVGNVQQGGWNVGLRAVGSSNAATTFVTECDAELVVSAANLVPRIFVIEANLDGVTSVFSVAIGHKRSDCAADQPTELECEVVAP